MCVLMKKDRNCGVNPIVPNYQMNGMMPTMQGMPMPYPMPGPMNYSMMNSVNPLTQQQINTSDSMIGQLKQQVDSLERRVNRLEQMLQSENKYTNTSNYQMM